MTRPRRTNRPPIGVVALAVLATAFFTLPFLGLLWRAPWSDLVDVIEQESVRRALWLSIQTSILSTVVAVMIGVPLAWVLARVSFPFRSIVRALATLSMVLPPVVGGVALFFSFGRRGLFGQYLYDWFGIRLPFTTAGVVIAQTFVAMPFLVLTVESAFRQFDMRYEDAARSLGAGRWYAFRRITLPTIRPAILAGVVLAWARALGEFGATITFAGNLPGTTQTMPLATYIALESDPGAALILSIVLIVVSFGVLVALRDRWLGNPHEVTRP
ncbi:MAG: putative molybdenum transport system permease protein ModB [Actinomycetota bacterium]|jgi:molybdate transport system permease protein